jgi:hypothetical protein
VTKARHREGAGAETERRSILERCAGVVGEQWARGRRDELRSSNRRAAGGWPGTVAEARAYARAHLTTELARHRLTDITSAELEVAARATYASARATWLAFADADDSIDRGAP